MGVTETCGLNRLMSHLRRRPWTAGIIHSSHVARRLSARCGNTNDLRSSVLTQKAADKNRSSPGPPAEWEYFSTTFSYTQPLWKACLCDAPSNSTLEGCKIKSKQEDHQRGKSHMIPPIIQFVCDPFRVGIHFCRVSRGRDPELMSVIPLGSGWVSPNGSLN